MRGYRASELTGQQMCERLLQILEDVPKVGPILNSLIELLEDKEKQDELAKAWRNFKPVRAVLHMVFENDFPS